MDDYFARVIDGIVMLDILSSVILNPTGFEMYMGEVFDNRCRFCGYKRDHPVVKHDTLRVECGW